ncbi:hypothetical protein [Jiangella mangrovi]|uniref:Uncharacterized protein n=1 Tax=Jiangella mangrovi TaxID=1524084 RepID=A0A7W9GX10_9ACTN|nr:hypothetical protein [Jiangella mangrovi]MBB5791613.1 hypothetical protein [Jiangella mangrovi]
MTATAATGSDECELKWCNEAGDHTVHRLYLTSLLTWRNTWLVGINVVQAGADPHHVELTATTRHTAPAVLTLKPDEAEAVGHALVEAAARAIR